MRAAVMILVEIPFETLVHVVDIAKAASPSKALPASMERLPLRQMRITGARS